ncbi:FCD domain-containing protein [Ruminococcaceae bacterium OttesenSCG-928-D13]|nr:FCD domain-containing protein [Ruminococcaceae bacterium OttesenSCG-928-D13]
MKAEPLFAKKDAVRNKTKDETLRYFLLDYIGRQARPVGAWRLKEELGAIGVSCSSATIGRILSELDAAGITVNHGRRGRALTDAGLAWVAQHKRRLDDDKARDTIFNMVKTNSFMELLDMLKTRRMLETEAAHSAAHRSSLHQQEVIRQALAAHKQAVETGADPTSTALAFHQAVAAASCNKALDATISLILLEEDKLEARFPRLNTREKGPDYAPEHQAIYQAICGRRHQEAANLMYQHINRLIETVDEQRRTGQLLWEEESHALSDH